MAQPAPLPAHARIVRARRAAVLAVALAAVAGVAGVARSSSRHARVTLLVAPLTPPAPRPVVLVAPLVRPLRPAGRTPALHVRWHESRAVGLPWAGHLIGGVELPAAGLHFVTFDSALRRSPSRPWRRFGTAKLIRTLLAVIDAYAGAHPHAPRVVIGDLSRPHGGPFGSEYGGLGHASHQDGVDADLYYPRRDRRERPPARPSQIDHALAQDLVTRFVRAGARYVFVGPHTGLQGPPGIVQVLALHDDHMHVRIRWP
jgi:hypothetical protein